MSFKNISFILHNPQLSENIGACARAIKNFSFNKLLLINPKPVFPNDKILATSVGAKDIIKKTEVFKNMEDSIKKLDILVATSARFRNKNIRHISISDLNKIDFSKRIGFLFGSEASGLSNREISYADYTLQIPSNKNFRSLNLSHSLIIIAHMVSGIVSINQKIFKRSKKIKNATKKDINNMVSLCIKNLEDKHFFYPIEKKPIMLENLRSIFFKLNLSKKETRILSSVFAGLSKKKVD
jgi:tRNA/rRNA methyltransferase